jgi:hypothetical protein
MRVDIKGAVKHTGLSEYAIRLGVKEKKIPVYRVGRGKFIFDTDMLDKAIEKEMLRSVED